MINVDREYFYGFMAGNYLMGRTSLFLATSVGIIAHSDCVTSGRGLGVTTFFALGIGKIVTKTDLNTNIAKLLKLRDDI